MPIRRRRFIEQPGTNPYLSTDIPDYMDRVAAFSAQTGIPYDSLNYNPVFFTPIPIYESTGVRRSFPVEPSAMWHPLMWLPERLSYPLILDVEGTERQETPVEHGVRVCYELAYSSPFSFLGQWWTRLGQSASIPVYPFPEDDIPDESYDYTQLRMIRPATGEDNSLKNFYDVETGTWLDIPYLVGVDVTTEEGCARMKAWMDGAPDEALDSIDLEEWLTIPDRSPMWVCDVLYRQVDFSLIAPEENPVLLIDLIINSGWLYVANAAYDCATEASRQLDDGDEDSALTFARLSSQYILTFIPMPEGTQAEETLSTASYGLLQGVDRDIVRSLVDLSMVLALGFTADFELYVTACQTLSRDEAFELSVVHGVDMDSAADNSRETGQGK